MSENTILAVPCTDYPFHIHIDSSNVGTGCFLIQQFPEAKLIIFNSKIFDEAEQKMSTLPIKLCGIVSASQTYEHYIIGSAFLKYLCCDHKPIFLPMGTKRRAITSVIQVSSNHNKIPKSQNYLDSRIKPCFPGYPKSKRNSGRVPETSAEHKSIPRDIEFYDAHSSPVTYGIQHDDNPKDTCSDFYPIHCPQGNENKVLRLHNDGENFTLNSLSNEVPTTTIQAATDCFRLG